MRGLESVDNIVADKNLTDISNLASEKDVAVHSVCADRFESACVFSDAKITIIGSAQPAAHGLQYAATTRTEHTDRVHYFGDNKHPGLGVSIIDLPISKSYYVEDSTEIPDVEVPF